jgi:hypothetical protein
MTLATHAIVGGAIMKLMPGHPVEGLILAFVSHFVLDAIPHWEYKLKSYDYNEKEPLKSVLRLNKNFLKDFSKMALDGILGLIVSLVLFSSFWGAVFAMLPDFFQFLYLMIRREPLTSYQKFHSWAHTKHETSKFTFAGIFSHVAVIVLVIIIFVLK